MYGKNAEKLTNIQLVSRFLNTTECMLQNDMLFPLTDGKITEFYWNDIARYIFENGYIAIDVIYVNDRLNNFEIGYHILDRYASDRLEHFGLVGKCLNADSM